MANHAKAQIIGNLTRDPELRYTPQGKAVCDIGVAVNRKWKTESGEQREEVAFLDCVAWGKTAEIAAEYLKKGRPVFFECRITQDRWESQDGKKMSKIKFVIENMQFIGAKPDGVAAGAGNKQQQEEGPPPGQEEDIPF